MVAQCAPQTVERGGPLVDTRYQVLAAVEFSCRAIGTQNGDVPPHQVGDHGKRSSLVGELLTEDLEFHGSLGLQRRGHVGFEEYVDLVHEATPDLTCHIDDLLTDGDQSFARLTYWGTHRGTRFGMGPTGKRIEYAGAALFRFREARIASVWVLGDIHGLLHQLRGDDE